MSKKPLDPDDYPSDSDESDDDYRPEGAESNNSASEIESDDHIEEEPGDDDEKPKGKKRKKPQKKAGKKLKLVNKEIEDDEQEVEKENESESKDNEEEEKKKADALWADFLGSTESESSKPEPKTEVKKAIEVKPKMNNKKKVEEITVTKIFDFAGEAVAVTETINGQAQLVAETISNDSTSSSSTSTSRPRSFGAAKTGGLGSVLSQLGKKNKLSVLEKSKLDWHSFKNNEGIQEDLETHNKGKHGYLERQDFLQRTDLKQFEIEKSLRQTKRSNR